MAEDEPITGRDAPGSEHQLWLAMQAAHKQHRNAAAALDALTAMPPGEFPSSERNLQIEMVAAEERCAFENYIETRLQLSELLLSKRMVDPVRPAPPDTTHISESRPSISGMTVLVVLAAFLFPTAFGVGYLARERKQVRNLEEARDVVNAALHQTQAQVQELARKLDAMKTIRPVVVRPRAPRKVLAKTKRPPTIQAAARRPASATGIVAKNHSELVQLQRRGERNYHEFTVTSRRRLERIGPLNMTVLNVDPRKKTFDVAIAVDDLAPDRRRINLYEPVWIDLKGRRRALELVFNGINGDEVQGYFSEPKSPHLSWRQVAPDSSLLQAP